VHQSIKPSKANKQAVDKTIVWRTLSKDIVDSFPFGIDSSDVIWKLMVNLSESIIPEMKGDSTTIQKGLSEI
jgi:hypothetical protein